MHPRALLAATALLLLACSELLAFTVEEESSATVEGLGTLGAVLGALELADFTVSLDEQLTNQGVNRGDLAEARVAALVLSSPDGTLDFMDTMRVAIESPGVATARIAHVEDIPEGATEVTLLLDDVDLVPYLQAESLAITTDVTGTAPIEDTTVVARIAVDIVATPQGACNAARED